MLQNSPAWPNGAAPPLAAHTAASQRACVAGRGWSPGWPLHCGSQPDGRRCRPDSLKARV